MKELLIFLLLVGAPTGITAYLTYRAGRGQGELFEDTDAWSDDGARDTRLGDYGHKRNRDQ